MNSIVLPNYITTQPSTGKKITFRPFNIKEEKSLLLALQEGDINHTSAAIKNVLSVCTFGKLDPEKTPYYDMEYIFLQIRSKSVGEEVDLLGGCDCGTKNQTKFSIDLSQVVVEPKVDANQSIKIPDTEYTIKLNHPSIDDFVLLYESKGAASTEVLINCIQSIYTGEEIMDWDKTQITEFIESMTPKQQKGIAQFLKNMPMVKIPTKYTCVDCGKEHTSTLSGMSNFFL